MKIRRKSNDCHNCHARLDAVYNYCPLCGQENNDNNVSFGTLFRDFFSNYFALDSRFSHTFKPFFLKPGYLTNKFNEGKRMSYANPVRLYLIVSLFFFFVFSHVGQKMIADDNDTKVSTEKKDKGIAETDIGEVEQLTVAELEELKNNTGVGFKFIMQNIPPDQKKQIIDNIGADSAAMYHIHVKDTVTKKWRAPKEDDPDEFLSDHKFNWNLFKDELKDNDDLTHQQVYDSIYHGGASVFEERVALQRIKVERSDKEYFVGYILKNLPLMMFFMLPVFALLLKLLYIRRKVLYIKHLIHALHLHSFAYLTYGTTLLVSFYLIDHGDPSAANGLGDWVNLIAFVLVSTYAYISFLKVYHQHWFKTLVKFNIQGIAYAFLLIVFFGAEAAISFMLF